MSKWPLFLLLLGIVCQDVLACSYNQLHNCDGYSEMTESRIILPKAQDIDTKCDEYTELFQCVTAYQGDCKLHERIIWQSIEKQISHLCSLYREAYVTNDFCWSEEIESEIDFCIEDMKEDLDNKIITPCRAFDMFVNCCRDATEVVCDKASSLVMEGLASAFIAMSRDALNCTNNNSTSSSSTTTVVHSTKLSLKTTSTRFNPATTTTKTTVSPSTTLPMEKEKDAKDHTNLETSTTLNRITVQSNNWNSEEDSNFEIMPLTAGSTRLSSSVYRVCYIAFAFWFVF